MTDEKILAYINNDLSRKERKLVEKWIESSLENQEHYYKLKIICDYSDFEFSELEFNSCNI